jgi:tripartite-type tricarboxylate transporter receptor subunit TctC
MRTSVTLTRRDLLSASAAGVAISAANLVQPAVAHPLAKTAHILTGFTPGLQDALARLIADRMKGYANAIVVETRPGAAGRIAVEAVKTAESDGSIMLLAPLGFMMLFPHVYKELRYAPRDFTPVSTIASNPTLLTVGRKVPGDVGTLADFIAWCRANPKHATYGTAGAGTTLHFIGAMLGRTAGFEFVHVPYQGNGAIQDLLKEPQGAADRQNGRCDLTSSSPEIFVRSRDHRSAPAADLFPRCRRWRKPVIPR